MYIVLADCFVAFTGLMIVGVLWMAWEHRRNEAKARLENK